jgi:integral membrane protein
VKAAVLTRYRVMAYITGAWLLLLCLCMVFKYGFDTGEHVTFYVSQVHGVLYMIYLAVSFDLAWKMKWRIERILLIMLAGTVPFASFVAERRIAEAVRESGRIVAPVEA